MRKLFYHLLVFVLLMATLGVLQTECSEDEIIAIEDYTQADQGQIELSPTDSGGAKLLILAIVLGISVCLTEIIWTKLFREIQLTYFYPD